MKYNGYYNCKVCGKSWKHSSNWIPFELVDWFYDILFFTHLICGCCGGVFELDELAEDGLEIVDLPWVSLYDEIKGE